MDILVERCAGLDVHRDTVVATVRVPPDSSGRKRRAQYTQTFATTTAGITKLGDWLAEHRVTRAGIESTGSTGNRSCATRRCESSGGERTPPLVSRSWLVKLGAAGTQECAGGWEQPRQCTGRAGIVRRPGSG